MKSSRMSTIDRDQRLRRGQIDVLTMIARDAPTVETLEALAKLAESIEPSALAGVTVVDRAERSLEMAVFPSAPPEFARSIAGVPLGPPHVGTCAQALCQGEAVTSEDLSNESRFAPEWLKLCAESGIRSCCSEPVRNAQGSPLGTFMLCFRESRKRDAFDQVLIATCASLVELTLERRRVRQRQELMIAELEHRIKNLFSSIGALVHVSFQGGSDVFAVRNTLEGRIRALANAQALMSAPGGADLEALLKQVLEAYGDRIRITGPSVRLAPGAASCLSMAAHELATNATKYGALTTDEGSVSVGWRTTVREDGVSTLSFEWLERGGPPVRAPKRKGFGMRAIQRILASEVEGQVRLDFDPDGLRCAIQAPFGAKLGHLQIKPLVRSMPGVAGYDQINLRHGE
jgi:two-component sensor histidine kinase